MELKCALHIERVPTKENLADDPSRERYYLLERLQATHSNHGPKTLALELHLQAKFVKPYLYERFVNAQSWESLAVTAHAQWSRTRRAATSKLEASTPKDVEEVVVIG